MTLVKRFASVVVAVSTAFGMFAVFATPALADAPTIGGASLNSSTVYNDADGVEFTFTVSDTGNDDNEVLVIYHGYCYSDTVTAEKGQNTVNFKAVPDKTFAAGDCKVVVVNTDGEFSDPLNVPAFSVDTRAPRISTVVEVETPTDVTTPTFSFFSDEIGDIVESGSCVITTPAVVSTTAATTVTLYKDDASTPLNGATYSDCKLKVVDAAGNESNELSINSFQVVDFISFQVVPTSRVAASPANATSGQITVVANVPGQITTAGTASCEVKSESTVDPRLINAGSNTITLHSLEATVDYSADAGACELTFTPTDFPTSTVTVDLGTDVAWNGGTGPLTAAIAADASSPSVTQTIATLVPQTNKGAVGFSFTSNEGGTWAIVDSGEAGVCSAALTGAVQSDADDALVHPSTVARTVLLEAATPLPNATYGAAGAACDIAITDANGNPATVIDMPQFTIADNKGPTLTAFKQVRDQTAAGTVEFQFISDEFVPAASIDLNVDGPCFDDPVTNATFSVADIASDVNVLEIDLTALAAADQTGDFEFCQFSIEDAKGNRSNSLVIDTFNVGLAGPEITDVEFSGGTTDNPVTISFESDEAGTFNVSGTSCSVGDETVDLPLKKGVNTVTFDNLPAGAYACTITPFNTAGVAGNPLLPAATVFTVDTDETPDLVFEEVDAEAMTITFTSTTGGYLSFAEDSYCTSTTRVVYPGTNVIQLNMLPEGTAVSSCKFTVTNNDGDDTLTVPPFTVAADEDVLPKLPDGAVYRFYLKTSGKHVLTQDYNEANGIFTSNPNWAYEGQVFSAWKYDKTTEECLDGATPVYRYVNPSVGYSFVFIMSQAEMDQLASNPAWIKEGVVFCAKDKDVVDAGTAKAIRFYNASTVSHVFTIDPSEAAMIQQNPAWVLEGTAFVVMPKIEE